VTRRPHVLYVAWGYPPIRNSGVYRTLATANAFAGAGWDVTVLTADRDLYERQYGTDRSLEERIDPRIAVRRLRFPSTLREPDLARWSRARIASNVAWSSLAVRASSVPFPEPFYGSWRPYVEAGAEQIHAHRPVDLTVGTANPYVDLLAGWRLFRRHGVPYVVDYRDSWGLDLYRDGRAFSATSRAGRWERRLLGSALETWFVNDPIRQWYRSELPAVADRMQVVSNAYDGDVPGSVEAARAAAGRTALPAADAAESGLTFGYLGTVYGPIPLRRALEGWRRARGKNAVLSRSRLQIHGRLGHYGLPDPEVARLIREFRDDEVHFMGPVAKTDVSEVYAHLDALLLILSAGRYITSGKVFEYAASGLPVVSVHDPESAATSVMSGSPSWVATPSMDADDIADAIVAGADLALSRTAGRAHETIEWSRQFERTKQLLPRIDHLRRLVTEGHR
jgi:glycosyltransferase involved in cell wall biosynthesis